MYEMIILFVVMGGLMLISIMMGFRLREYLRNRHMSKMGEPERKRWEQFEKYRISQGGNRKTMLFMISFLVLFTAFILFLGSLIKAVVLMSILFIPLLLIEVRFVFKRKNKDQITLLIFLLMFFILYGLYGIGVLHRGYVLPVIQVAFFIFFGWWMTFKMKGEQEAVTLYNNLVVTAGHDIDPCLNGYSQRPFSKESDALKSKLKDLNFRKIAEDFGKRMGKELIFMDWKVEDNETVFYPVTANMIIAQIYLTFPSLGKDKLSWIKLNSDGRITVFVSKGDYDRILDEVTYHTLCRIIAERFEKAFIEFAKGSEDGKINSIKILRGEQK